MADDKKLIAFLLDALEDAYLEKTMLRTMVETYREHFPEIGEWEKVLEALKIEKRPDFRPRFAALRDAVDRSRDLEQALAQFLKDTPRKGGVH